ncbi:hypothetical protein GD429_22930 [Burkholderia sp. BE17]|nr:hypothetical protein [Burkholderia sp. BE17]
MSSIGFVHWQGHDFPPGGDAKDPRLQSSSAVLVACWIFFAHRSKPGRVRERLRNLTPDF